MLIAGIGCRRHVTAGDILAALNAALAERGLARTVLAALATGATKAQEPGLKLAADELGLPIVVCTPQALAAVENRLITRSEKSLAATGSGSLSEAAALAAAGADARLLAQRFIHEGVTIAFSLCGDPL